MTFRVGMKVVCVKAGRNPQTWLGRTPCMVGNIYTVRIVRWDEEENTLALLLEEIINPPFFDGEECGFYADRFRPVVERKTDISLLTALLVPGAKIREEA